MASIRKFIFNTGGVEFSAAELENVLKNGESTYQYHYDHGDLAGTCDELQTYEDGEGWEGWDELTWGEHYVVLDGVDHKIEIVEDNTGGEGHGEYTHLVFKLCDRFFKVEGTYYSYDGSYWEEDLYEVFPTQQTITVYQKTAVAETNYDSHPSDWESSF